MSSLARLLVAAALCSAMNACTYTLVPESVIAGRSYPANRAPFVGGREEHVAEVLGAPLRVVEEGERTIWVYYMVVQEQGCIKRFLGFLPVDRPDRFTHKSEVFFVDGRYSGVVNFNSPGKVNLDSTPGEH